MRLLNAYSLELEEFPANRVPVYAILSHTWGDDEVLYDHMMTRTYRSHTSGYYKIERSCNQARDDGYEYIWIDTCCIDKTSSAELSEAINSMYAWYSQARICYAYLADVSAYSQDFANQPELVNSRWFKRGWTLQELIAPADIVFYSRNWIRIGTKLTLAESISQITKIDVTILTGRESLESASIAKRMSWAASRETTRNEDMAYCLMGIFDVNMPMLYGEGTKAFIRLQEEIMRQSDDQSLFAWTDPDAAEETSFYGLLAKSPAYFATSGEIVPYNDWTSRAPFSLSNKGLRFEVPLHQIRPENTTRDDLYVAALDCPVPPRYEKFIGIYLQRLSTGNNQYARIRPQRLCEVADPGEIKTVYVRQHINLNATLNVYPQHGFQLREGPTDGDYVLKNVIIPAKAEVLKPISRSKARNWVPRDKAYTYKITKGVSKLAAALVFRRNDERTLTVLLGSTQGFGVGFDAVATVETRSFEELEAYFSPQQMGTWKSLDYHAVQVDVTPQVDAGVKYYLVDISIHPQNKQATGRRAVIPLASGQPLGSPPILDEFSSPPLSSKRSSFWKVKAPFKSP